MNLSPVQEFYKGQTIFITGGTGFMGKVTKLFIVKMAQKYKTFSSIGSDRKTVIFLFGAERNFSANET